MARGTYPEHLLKLQVELQQYGLELAIQETDDPRRQIAELAEILRQVLGEIERSETLATPEDRRRLEAGLAALQRELGDSNLARQDQWAD